MPTDRVHCQRGQVNLLSVNDGASCVEKRRGVTTAPSPAALNAPAAVGGKTKAVGLAIHSCLLVSWFIHRA